MHTHTCISLKTIYQREHDEPCHNFIYLQTPTHQNNQKTPLCCDHCFYFKNNHFQSPNETIPVL